jgi:hypothetical protein
MRSSSGQTARDRVLRCAAQLQHAASLARIAGSGWYPWEGAQHIVEVLDDLKPLLKHIRRIANGQ